MGSRISTKTRSQLEAIGKATFMREECTIVILRKKSTSLLDMANDFLDQMRLCGLREHFKFVKSENTIYNTSTGRRIRLKGLYNPGDNKVNLTGLNFDVGQKVIIMFDEAHEFTLNDESSVLMAARGGTVFRMYSINPWSNRHWLVKRITAILAPDYEELLKNGEMYAKGVDIKKSPCLVHYSNWRCNDFKENLKDTINELESYKSYNIQRWRTASVGMPGIEGDLVFEYQITHMFTSLDLDDPDGQIVSVDFGQKRDALSCSLYEYSEAEGMMLKHNLYWIPKENYYWIDDKKHPKTASQMSNDTNVLGEAVIDFIVKYGDPDLLDRAICDSAAYTFISVLNDKLEQHDDLLFEFEPCIKTQVIEGIDALRLLIDQRNFRVNKRCSQPLRELEELQWNYNNQGELNSTRPFVGDDHSIDEQRYAANQIFGIAKHNNE